MLLEFRASNYRSFKNELIFSMEPAPKQKDLEYSIQKEKVGSKTKKAISTAVIYGPNASGKTNIIGAMDTFRTIVIKGNIKDAETISPVNVASSNLEVIPFCCNDEPKPVCFSIKFIENNVLFEYKLVIDIGKFLEKDYDRNIIEESLKINDKNIFLRNKNTLEFLDISTISQYINNATENNLTSAKEISQGGLTKTDLFLMNGFKSIFSSKIVNLILEWFENKFMVIYRADLMQVSRQFVDPKENTIYMTKTLSDAAAEFGINSNGLGFKPTKEGTDSVLYSVFGKNKALPAEMFESYGTIRFVNEFPLVIKALMTGSVLVIDEFDASIHPMALMNIIKIFHNDDINKKHAQLIFNTHNPIFLDSDLFRRDEIKFVERNDDTHESTSYSLSDFKTSGSSGVRKGDDYMKNYFISRYGAIKEVDFTHIIESLLDAEGENNNGN